jgi:hypothetical protein
MDAAPTGVNATEVAQPRLSASEKAAAAIACIAAGYLPMAARYVPGAAGDGRDRG